ncbi:MAG: amidohydrolase family protein [Firmicutes bacterium]|nr:amidohydrolase family protein [Bacillota bacterium]
MEPRYWDAHQHFWQLARGDYGWLKPTETVLYRDFHPHDLRPALLAAGIARTIVVQAAPTVAETHWLLDLAESTDFIAGVVGWVDLTASHFAATLDALRSSPYFVGIRPMLQDLPDPRWILQPQVRSNLAYCAATGVRVDWLVTPRELPWVAEVASQIPDLYHIVDHLGKPSGPTPEWTSALTTLAAHPRGYCKVSGLGTLPPIPSPPDTAWKREMVHRVWEWFGPERLVFGSDWPVCLSGGLSYADALASVQRLLPSQDPSHVAAVFGRNAQAFYAKGGGAHP